MDAIRVPGRVGFWDIVLVVLGGLCLAIIAAVIVFPFVRGSDFVKETIVDIANCVGSGWAYVGLAHDRDWQPLRDRFSTQNLRILFAAAACGVALQPPCHAGSVGSAQAALSGLQNFFKNRENDIANRGA
jgi:hypothetical protein